MFMFFKGNRTKYLVVRVHNRMYWATRRRGVQMEVKVEWTAQTKPQLDGYAILLRWSIIEECRVKKQKYYMVWEYAASI